jgi:hypothetical protein
MSWRYMGSGGIAPPFLTSALGGGEWSSSRLFRFTPGERAPRVHWIGGQVGPIAGLDVTEKKKSLSPAGNRIPVVQSMA